MNIKMATNAQLSTTESKKHTKQTRTGTDSYIWRSFGESSVGRGKEENGGKKMQVLRSTNWQVQNRQEDVKNSVGNQEAKELICRTHGHELRGRLLEGMGVGGRGGKKGGNWDSCNSIINKMYLKKAMESH